MGKIILVTGASSDIGTALIRKIAGNYDKVLAHYCHWSESLEQLKQDIGDKIVFLEADFLDTCSVQNMISVIQEQEIQPDHIVHFPSLKALAKKYVKTKWDTFERGWEISVHSLFLILQAFLPFMKKQNYGKVIVMLTAYTFNTPPKFLSAYVTVKYALLGLMNSLAVEYESKGITFNGVSPDMMQTKFLSELPDLLVEQYAAKCPKKRILAVDEVVPIFDFLLSEESDSINGVNIKIH